MRILLSFLLLMTSFVFAEICETTTVYVKDMERSISELYDTWTIMEVRENSVKLKEAWKDGKLRCSHCGVEIKSYPKQTTKCKPSDNDLEDWSNCRSGKKSKTWIKKLSVRIGDQSHTSSDKITTYTCDDPKFRYDYLHPRTDEPIDESDADYTCSGSACSENLDEKLKDTDSVPCFGSLCKPDYKNGESFQGMYDGVPCFANNPSACNKWAPDYINNKGVPCWGNFCSNDGKAPIYTNDDGKKCVGPYCEGANGNLNDGSKVENGNVTSPGGNGSGNGSGTGPGEGEDTGDGSDNNTCNHADCSGSSIGKGQKVDFDKDSIYESKYDSSFSAHVSKNPINIENTSLGRMVNSFIPNLPAAKCPAWTMPNLFSDDVIDLTPPCWIFDLIKSLVIIGSLILARKIVLGA